MSVRRDSPSCRMSDTLCSTTQASVADFELVYYVDLKGASKLLAARLAMNNRGPYNAHGKQLQKLWSATSRKAEIQSTIRVGEASTKPPIYRLILTLVGTSLPPQPQKSSFDKFFLSTTNAVDFVLQQHPDWVFNWWGLLEIISGNVN